MYTVGVRELKNRLSAFLRQVRSGESVLVTDRGEVVAVPAGLLALARRGAVTLGSPAESHIYRALPRTHRGRQSAAQLLDAERGSR